MEENKLSALIWKLIMGTICVLIITVASCSSYEVKKASEMVEAGVDPLAVKCLFDASGNSERCMLLKFKSQ